MIKVVVIGAGPAGLTLAYELSKVGKYKIEVFEASHEVGGMARSVNMWGQIVDIGPHRFFSSDRRINELWLEVMGRDYNIIDRKTRILYLKKFYDYPLQLFNALSNLGFLVSIQCALSYLFSIFKNYDESSFSGWVSKRFGKKLFEIFFKGYSEKLWGIKCDDLDSDFAKQRIKNFNLKEAIISLFKKRSKILTLTDIFAYPKSGSGEVYKRMAEKILENGGIISVNKKVQKLDIQNGKVCAIFLENKERLEADIVVSTMPLTSLVLQLDNVTSEVKEACENLKYRNTIVIYLLIARENIFPDQWIYVNDTELKVGRITNFKNWKISCNEKSNETILALEYWASDGDEAWIAPDEKLIKVAKEEIVHTGLVEESEIMDAQLIRVPKCYPMYTKNYQDDLNIVKNYIEKIENIYPIGRYGSFKYNNQDHSILMGLLLAKNIDENAQVNLWDINTDYSYQEKTRITRSGLVLES